MKTSSVQFKQAIFVGLTMLAVGCSFDSSSSTSIRLQVEAPSNGDLQISSVSSTMTTAPSSWSFFSCFIVNITAMDIPSSTIHVPTPPPQMHQFMEQGNDVPGASCGYPGMASKPFTLENGEATVELQDILTGPRRNISLIGVVDPNNLVCPLNDMTFGQIVDYVHEQEQAAGGTGQSNIDLYRISHEVVDLFADTVVQLSLEDYDANDDPKVDCDFGGGPNGGGATANTGFGYGSYDLVMGNGVSYTFPAYPHGEFGMGQLDDFQVDETISPLPAGLSVNSGNGTISGTPTSMTPYTSVRITANSPEGEVEAYVGIEVLQSFIVNSTADVGDSNLPDGICYDGGSGCTLRAAIEQANNLVGQRLYVHLPFNVNFDSVVNVTDRLVISGPVSGGSPPVVKPSAVHTNQFLIVNSGVDLHLRELDIENFYSSGSGGAIQAQSNANLKFEQVMFVNNHAVNRGGAIRHAGGGELDVVGCFFDANEATSATSRGGAISIDNTGSGTNGRIDHTQFKDNNADAGGAIEITDANANIFIEASTFDGNVADGAGGLRNGGAIRSSGKVDILRNLFLNNQTDGGKGGAVALEYTSAHASPTLFGNNTFFGNVSQEGGGAIFVTHTSSHIELVFNHNSFKANSVEGNFTGGSMFLEFNAGSTGGAAFANNGYSDSKSNTSGSPVDDFCDFTGPGIPVTVGANAFDVSLAGAQNCGTHASDIDNLGAGNLFGALLDNGGPTLTMMPLSPLIDSGDGASCAPMDARFFPRDDGACDIGAVEVQ